MFICLIKLFQNIIERNYFCRYEAIVPGDPELIVEYRGKLYCFVDEGALQQFMKYV